MGVKTWSWYIPTITSNFFKFCFKKIVSVGNGPSILTPFLFKNFIAGIIIFFSSLNFSLVSQCGFIPVIAKDAFFF